MGQFWRAAKCPAASNTDEPYEGYVFDMASYCSGVWPSDLCNNDYNAELRQRYADAFPDVLMAQLHWSQDDIDQSYDPRCVTYISDLSRITLYFTLRKGWFTSLRYVYADAFDGAPSDQQIVDELSAQVDGWHLDTTPPTLSYDDVEVLIDDCEEAQGVTMNRLGGYCSAHIPPDGASSQLLFLGGYGPGGQPARLNVDVFTGDSRCESDGAGD